MLVAVVTLMLAVALEAVWFRNPNLNGGTGGAPIANPTLFGLELGIGVGAEFPRPQFGLVCLFTLAAVAVGAAERARRRRTERAVRRAPRRLTNSGSSVAVSRWPRRWAAT